MVESTSTSTTSEASSTSRQLYGKGLDVGTANLVCAVIDKEGNVSIAHERNVFVDVKPDLFTRSLLNQQRVPHAVKNGSILLLGRSALEFANVVGKETRRPMCEGTISPREVSALPVVKLLLEQLVGQPRVENEALCFSVPAAPTNVASSVAYHQGVLENLLAHFGYRPFSIPEGLAVVYSELSQQDYTGIGVSFGAGMVNVTIAYRSVPTLSFSLTRSGDWVDERAAEVLGMKIPRVTLLKEQGMSAIDTTSREQEAIAIFARSMIGQTVERIGAHLMEAEGVPEFDQPVDLVCSGGTTLIGGFVDIFREEVAKIDFPVPLREIRRARDPLHTTARGCLLAAMNSD